MVRATTNFQRGLFRLTRWQVPTTTSFHQGLTATDQPGQPCPTPPAWIRIMDFLVRLIILKLVSSTTLIQRAAMKCQNTLLLFSFCVLSNFHKIVCFRSQCVARASSRDGLERMEEVKHTSLPKAFGVPSPTTKWRCSQRQNIRKWFCQHPLLGLWRQCSGPCSLWVGHLLQLQGIFQEVSGVDTLL